jgi:hypothetical protein
VPERDSLGQLLADAWARVADVLAWFQERVARESYLASRAVRTSIHRLIRLLARAGRTKRCDKP